MFPSKMLKSWIVQSPRKFYQYKSEDSAQIKHSNPWLAQLTISMSKMAPFSKGTRTLGKMLTHLCLEIVCRSSSQTRLGRRWVVVGSPNIHDELPYHGTRLFDLIKSPFQLNIPLIRVRVMLLYRKLPSHLANFGNKRAKWRPLWHQLKVISMLLFVEVSSSEIC